VSRFEDETLGYDMYDIPIMEEFGEFEVDDGFL
jgi:hypothetical protein